MNSDAAAGNLRTVECKIVRAGADARRIALELGHIFRPGRRKRVVHRVPTLLLGVVVEKRKLGDPDELEVVGAQQVVRLCDVQAHAAESVRNGLRGAALEDQEISGLAAGSL